MAINDWHIDVEEDDIGHDINGKEYIKIHGQDMPEIVNWKWER